MRTPPKSIKITITFLVSILMAIALPVGIAAAQTTTVKAQASNTEPAIGSTFTVDITISNVQNLYGVDVTLSWDHTILRVQSATSSLGIESHAGGVLHNPVVIVDDTSSQDTAQYHVAAVSQSPAAAFSGSGKIATVTFSVLKGGHSALTLVSELADKPVAGENSNPINHKDVSTSITTLVPEFPTAIALVAFLVLAAASLVFAKKRVPMNAGLPNVKPKA